MKYFPKNTDLIDIHSHHLESEAGVFRIYNVFTSEYLQIPSDKPVSIGLHPWYLSDQATREMPEILRKAVKKENVLAIGEAGLDKVIQTSVEEQLSAFRTQIEISIEFQKPLIIHCVKAFSELLNLRKEFKNAPPWIIHGFNANQTIAKECISLGIYISLSQRLLRNHEKAHKIIKKVPLSLIFAETDEDPNPIREIYRVISKIYGVSQEEIQQNIFANFHRVFSPFAIPRSGICV
jgi:TatD DNase family protein